MSDRPAPPGRSDTAAGGTGSDRPLGVDLAGVSVSYDGVAVVDDIDLQVPSGGWVAIVGPNGAGKSSLLKAVAGLAPASGSMRVDGHDLHLLRPAARARHVAYLPQNPTLPPGMTVAEYVLLGRTVHLGYLAAESRSDRDRVHDVLEVLALTSLAGRDVDTLSGGEAQRATLARALAQQASLVLLDEPTSALDLGHQIRVLELVDRLRRQQAITVVSAMHDLSLAGQFADRLLLLSGGRAVAAGAPAVVLTEVLLDRHYGARVQVIDGPGGARIVVPLRGGGDGMVEGSVDPRVGPGA